METSLIFGGETLRITCNPRLMHVLAPLGESYVYSKDGQSLERIIRLEENLDQIDAHDAEGWTKFSGCGLQQAVYSTSGKTAFALQYDSNMREIVVQANIIPKRYFRIGILFAALVALHKKYVGLHGVTLECGNEVVILSAPSGTGKTTLAKLLEKYHNAQIINGDFALLSLENGRVIFEPTPFCGSSGICLKQRVPVDRIIFLEQSDINRWQTLDLRSAILKCLSNSFVPAWDDMMQATVQTNVISFLSNVKVNLFAFRPDEEAADLVLRQILCEGYASLI